MTPFNSERDAEGRWVIGNPRQGCPWCGEVGMKIGADNRAVVYHPALECCPTAVSRQLDARRDELEWRRSEIAETVNHLRDVEATLARATGAEERGKLERSLAALERKVRGLQGQATEAGVTQDEADEYLTGLRQLSREVTRLEKKLGWMRRERGAA